MLVGIAANVFKVKGQKSKSYVNAAMAEVYIRR